MVAGTPQKAVLNILCVMAPPLLRGEGESDGGDDGDQVESPGVGALHCNIADTVGHTPWKTCRTNTGRVRERRTYLVRSCCAVLLVIFVFGGASFRCG